MNSVSTIDEWTRGLNPAQREAVEHVHGPILVLAGAGSGKTRVLTTRIASLIHHHGVPPERIFAVTFTNKAATEMKHRIGTLLALDPAGLWIGTFHSLSARLLRREAERLGFSRQFTIYDEDDRLSLIRRLMEEQQHSTKLFPPRMVQSMISSAKNRMMTPDALAATDPFDRAVQVASTVFGSLQPALKAANAMDFDDLMLHPLTLFRQHPDRLAYYRERFHFVLVDEFQDTNRAQYELIRTVGHHQNVFVVGDDDQSIYGWRGAEIKNMRDFQTDFPGTRMVRLEENYRSTQIVLDAANGVIAPNTGRLGKTLRTMRRGGEKVTCVAAADERDEAEWIAREFQRRERAGDWSYRDMAVLYRTNSQSRSMEEAFRRAGIPYRVVGAVSFYDRREVKDILAYLRLVANPQDDEAFLRAISVPRRGIGDTSVATLRTTAEDWHKTMLEAAGIADRVPGLRPNVREAFKGFAALIERLRAQAATAPPAVVLEAALTALDYEAFLLSEGPEGAERWENVRELLASAAAWSEVVANPEDIATPLERFLAEAALLSANDTTQGAERGATLMTIHTAKGLEWPVVAVSGLEDGLFPLARSLESLDGLEEERRLCYVALTRAKDKLYLSWARARRRGGELKPGIVSRFTKDLPPGILDEQRTSSMSLSGYPARPPRYDSGSTTFRWGETATPSRKPVAPVEEVSQDSPRYIKGERVRHRRFGSGTILGLTGTGRDLKVSVAFDDPEMGTKQLIVVYAGLERDWEGEGA